MNESAVMSVTNAPPLTRHPPPFKSEMKSLDVQGAEASASYQF